MKRWLLVGIPILLLLGIAAFFWFSPGKKEDGKAPEANTIESIRTKPYTEASTTYRISAAYPTTTPLGEAYAEDMQGWVIGEISHFKDTLPAGQFATLLITYEASSTGSTASYLFKEENGGLLSSKAFRFAGAPAASP